jgi:FeS assembly protein IscX
MSLKWTDSLNIAIELDETHPDIDPLTINFVDLQRLTLQLSNFDDEANRCGERILEAIQGAWIEERE